MEHYTELLDWEERIMDNDLNDELAYELLENE